MYQIGEKPSEAFQAFFWWQTVAEFDNPMVDEASSILAF
jgi:hypothetical protein